ncbi:MAG: hypothetical protein V7742_16435 [Halioglobus sp.]
MAVDHERIKRLLGDKDESSDTSLRAKTLERALEEKIPTTLTPYEWQQWYAEHGVPDSHSRANPGNVNRLPWWRRWFRKDK